MIHIICLTKSYNEEDFKIWYKWYEKLHCRLHIFDNDSSVPIEHIVKSPHTYDKISGWPNQYKLYEEILKTNRFQFSEGDNIFCLDDDEFIWYNGDKFNSLEDAMNAQYKQLDCVLLPQILMSTKKLETDRNRCLLEHFYRRNDYSSQGKAYFRYFKDNKYRFSKTGNKENGHVPWINGIRMSDVVGSGVSKTTYGITDYNADLRLYHYHIKSLSDWVKKIERGSAACPNQWYDNDIKKNKNFGSYDVLDMTVYNSQLYASIK